MVESDCVLAALRLALNSVRISEGRLIQFFAGGDFTGFQKGFDEFAFAADGQAGEIA